MLEEHAAEWKRTGRWKVALVTDEQLEGPLRCAEALVDASPPTLLAPNTADLKSSNGDHGESSSDVNGSGVEAIHQSATQGSQATSPPTKRRRLSEGGSAVNGPRTLNPSQTSPSEIRTAMVALFEQLLLEFAPGQRTGQPSAKALGKQPEK
ncbi:hypothetical protein FRC00_001116 [Tulasnella sp. 408]|nr:hypothetical protein FRC00_001116 [Tulasnella sp. 408]